MIDKYISRLKIVGEHEIAEYLQQLKEERDAAIEELRGICYHCAHLNSDKIYIKCDKTGSCIHVNYGMSDAVDEWQWRGIQDAK